ncbi:MAG: hypothetical protein F083_2602 [bacterium F083]|nr:MAG: hypothetical protein F083_2602 [bacterium F083]
MQAMREAGKPVSAGDVTKALNADRKEVDKAFAELKKEGAIVSPVVHQMTSWCTFCVFEEIPYLCNW